MLLAACMIALAPHNLHISHGRMAVEEAIIALRVRFFRHDLEDALKAYHRLPDLALADDAAADSLFLSYLDERFVLVSDHDTLNAAIVSSGEERDIWWYGLQFKAEAPIKNLQITNRTLFDLFGDQQNIFQLTHFPSEHRETLYFVDGEDTYSVGF